ncbi:hypothetical protein RPE78_09545 [Thioclava litoralis]|uniref:Uncharacterized protein n=1 Tax=Thioclava litoralis TaxID=3076557 RepID=A0ABZ1DYH9_9RHOB|nr:hypothetical protein RPE78_09545 [Thioclava sp. FTW29]
MGVERSFTVVEAGGLPDYPISSNDRLDSHYFVTWNLKRWRGSEFRRGAYADPEVGFFGMELFWAAQDETPIGTLPCDDESLAFLLRMAVPRWRELNSRVVSPLHGWARVQCDNGQTRLAHPVVTAIALEALGSKRRNDAKHADDRMRKRLGTIAGHLAKSIPGGARLAESEERLNAISDWIEAAYPGGSATVKRIREAIEDLSSRV